MAGILEADRVAVRVDPATLRGETPGVDSTRYRVRLCGTVDDRWAEVFWRIQADSTAFRRLRFERETSSVSFLCRRSEGPQGVMESLERLEELVELVESRLRAG